MKEKFKRISDWFNELTPTTQGMILLDVVLVIGIIFRWDYIIEEIKRGFNFFNGN